MAFISPNMAILLLLYGLRSFIPALELPIPILILSHLVWTCLLDLRTPTLYSGFTSTSLVSFASISLMEIKHIGPAAILPSMLSSQNWYRRTASLSYLLFSVTVPFWLQFM